MNKPHGIIIFGASGSGTTTLAQEMAKILGFIHLDLDDYFWHKSDIPFSEIRPKEERQKKLLDDVKKHKQFIMSGSIVNWDEPFLPYFDLAIFVTTPTDIRLRRLRKREFAHFGERINEGGDLYKNHEEFLEWAGKYDIGDLLMRSLASHEQWISNCPCPVIRVNGTDDYAKSAINITNHFYTEPGEPIMKHQ